MKGLQKPFVMGISGKAEELVNQSKLNIRPIPIIKRFSGGGTVIVDENTLFVTFICQKTLHDFSVFPEPIMKWSETIYKPVFENSLFSLKENDYVLGEKNVVGMPNILKRSLAAPHFVSLGLQTREDGLSIASKKDTT